MSGFAFRVTRVTVTRCAAPECGNSARNAVKMIFPSESEPLVVCGHHKRWAKDEQIERGVKTA